MFSSVAPRQLLCKRLIISSFPASPPCSKAQRTASSQAQTYCSHQRRSSSSSSSKPSNAPHGRRVIAQQQQAPRDSSASSQPNGEKRTSARLGRRKAREATGAALSRGTEVAPMNLPSVPSTNHLHPADIAISAFFSLHRPISVTSSIPPAASSSSFEDIFRPGSERIKPADVISTISSAVSTLEAPPQSPQARSYDGATDEDFRTAIASVSISNGVYPDTVNHLDGDPNFPSLDLTGQLLSAKYTPFTPPPAPTPINNATNIMISSTEESSSATPQKTYSTILTILEATYPNGSKTYTARTSPIVSRDVADQLDGAVRSTSPMFLERMRIRQERWEDYRRSRGDMIWAISVKRQRRLKMKKHKYKKLMRRTRNLRRRMEKN